MTTNLTASEWIIEELIRLGSTRFVISPGSRSTPLTVAAARNPRAKTTIHYDERGAAYFALGHARTTGTPAVLICTSGTAVANYFPAVIEASMDNIPLIILSADRPPELIDVGANQAIFQENIYCNYTRFARNLLPPDNGGSLNQTLTIVDELYTRTVGIRPGPTHLNCMFREPLLPTDDHVHESSVDEKQWALSESIYKPMIPEVLPIPTDTIEQIVDKIKASQSGLIVVGRGLQDQHNENILKLATALNCPILPDVQSELRYTRHPNVINHFDLSLLHSRLREIKPELLIHLGGAFTSKRLLTFLNDPQIYYVAIKTTPERIDPNHQVDITLQIDLNDFFLSLPSTLPAFDSNYLILWREVEQTTRKLVRSELASAIEFSEPHVSKIISETIPQNHSLMLGNSLAIREMEMFASSQKSSGRIFANRGTSGIDGLLATAAGIQSSTDTPLTLLIGDLAFLHDVNSLALVKASSQPIVIVLINNNGGGIFNFLPVQAETDVFEEYFGTPHDLRMENAARLFGIPYLQANDLDTFKSSYEKTCSKNHSSIIEITSDRYKNHAIHEKIYSTIRES